MTHFLELCVSQIYFVLIMMMLVREDARKYNNFSLNTTSYYVLV